MTPEACRDTAMAVLEMVGVWHNAGPSRLMIADVCHFKIAYRTHTAWSPPKAGVYYGVAVWADSEKVLDVEWDDAGSFEVLIFRCGDWEDDLAALKLG